MLRPSRYSKPDRKPKTSLDEYYDSAPIPKVRRRRDAEDEGMDTRELAQRKVHPIRDKGYMRWLWFKPCAVAGLTNKQTGEKHECWSPHDRQRGRTILSDPAHTGKLGMGIKGDDSGCFPLCRHAHREQEGSMDRFDQDYGINRFEIAAKYYAEYQKEEERKR